LAADAGDAGKRPFGLSAAPSALTSGSRPFGLSAAPSALTSGRIERALTIASESPSRLLAIVGPTASGKTELAIAVAEGIGGEIVSADSIQVYRGFDLGSGKPNAEERARAPHHLVDALDPTEGVDAAA
jgi:tRNA dimethylallyltransferase